jgi:hypothetical protein
MEALQATLNAYHTESIASLVMAIMTAIDEDRDCLEQLAASEVTMGFLKDRLSELINQQELRIH